MKKINLKKIRFKKVNLNELDDRTLLMNLYATQFITLILGGIIILFQDNPLLQMFNVKSPGIYVFWGLSYALLVLVVDWLVSRWVPEHVTDDGGMNVRIFGNRPIWHIALISLVVAVCEELLFRGALQHIMGPYWTSILFAAIHIRYLQHWIMTGLVFGISYGLGWIYLQTGSLWTPIVAHFAIDFIMGCILRFRRET